MKKSSIFVFLLVLFATFPCIDLPCCASDQTTVLAEVNGKTIDERAFLDRMKAIHRYATPIRSEGGAGRIEFLDLLEQMIDEALIIQDAYRVGLDKDPDFRKRLESYTRNQAVIRLRKEEVLDKIDVGEEDLLDYFKKHYETNGLAPEGQFEKNKERIRKKLTRERDKELSDNFVAMLRKQADVWIDSELYDLLDPEKDYVGKKSVVARVNGQPIPLDDMLRDMRQAFQQRTGMYNRLKTDSEKEKMREGLKQQTLDGLITYQLVEQEAITRDYIKDPVFTGIITRIEEGLLINEFRERIIYPLAIPTKKKLTEYYEQHINDFRQGSEVWFVEMTFETRERAEKALKELKEGANFEYLAARVSERWTPRGARVWVSADRFPPEIGKELNRLEVGEISDVLAEGRHYKIIKLKGKRGGEPEEFSRVVGRLKKIVGQQEFNAVLSDYLSKLRKRSNIKIDKKALRRIEKKYSAEPTEKAETTDSPD